MTKLVSRIVTAVALLGLAAPALASTSPTVSTPAAQTPIIRHHRSHTKVAAADVKSAEPKKETKKTEKKTGKKAAAKSTKAETPAAPSATPAPAGK